MTVFDLFWVHCLTISCENKRPCFDNFTNASCVFAFSHAIITMCPPLVFTLFVPFSCFSEHTHTHNNSTANNAHHHHHTTPHTVHAFLSGNVPSAMKRECSDMCTCNRPLSCEWFEHRSPHCALCSVLCVCVFWNLRGFRPCGGKAVRVYQEKDEWFERVVLNLFANFKRARSSGCCWRICCASDDSTWAIFGKQKNGDEEWTKHQVKVVMNCSFLLVFSMKNARSYSVKQCFTG